MLISHGYPDLAQHKAQHDNYVSRMHEFDKKVGTGGVSLAITLLPFLKEWWTSHILKTDRQYAAFFKQKGVV